MRTFDTPEPILAIVEIGGGHLDIRASDRSDTVVEVRPSDPAVAADVKAAEETKIDLASSQLTVRAPKRKMRMVFGRPPSVDVTIDLPSNSRVEATALADIRTSGRLDEATFDSSIGAVRLAETGRLRVRTAAGDVSLDRSSGPTDVETSSGKIRIGGIADSAVIKTSAGDIDLGDATGDVRLTTAYGDITVGRAEDDLDAKTAYGSIRVGEIVRGTVALATGFGELEIGIRPGTAAWLDVSSGYGTVRSELDETEQPESTDEKVRVRARTSVGDIVIHRATPTSTTSTTSTGAGRPVQ